jgi:5-methylcytosine-specific restriction endonuclease McrA
MDHARDPVVNTRAQLKGSTRSKLIEWVRSTQPDCWLCGHPIDPARSAQLDPLGSTVDEIVPRSKGGSALDPHNLGHAHRTCNSTRGARPLTDQVRAECRAAWQRHQPVAAVRSRRW